MDTDYVGDLLAALLGVVERMAKTRPTTRQTKACSSPTSATW